MGKKSPPDPPDPKDTSAAQTGTNVSTAVANAYLGNINEYGPDGSTQFKRSGQQQFHDPYTGATYDIPTFSRYTQLSPFQQRLKGVNDTAQLNLAGLARDQSKFLGGYMNKPFQYESGDHEKWATGLYDKLNSDNLSHQREDLATRLSNQGIKLGSAGYEQATHDFEKSQMDARNQFGLDSYKTGFSSAQAQRNQPLNEIAALMSGSQVQQPIFMGANMPTIPTTDNAGIISQNYQDRLNAWQQKQGAMGSMFSGIGGLFGMLSDKRAKKDIKKVGKTDNGLNVYTYRYIDEPAEAPIRMGLMAQEVEKKVPAAVATAPDGFKRVDYGRAIGFGA